MNKIKSVLFAAGILLALVFTFSCSSNYSGSGEQSYNYCIMAGNTCLAGPFTASTCTGQLSNSCPKSSNSSGGGSSSSRTGMFSSGVNNGSSSSVKSSSSIQTGIIRGTPVTYKGETYNTVVIDNQTWMARNLNYDVEGSRCYGEGGLVYSDDLEAGQYVLGHFGILSDDEIQDNCDKYGRLYDWATAMKLPDSCNKSSCASQVKAKHQGICPNGWHIPSYAEWGALIEFASDETDDGIIITGRYLKARNSGGEDKYGFSALLGGRGDPDYLFEFFNYEGNFYSFNSYEGFWWGSTEYGSSGITVISLNMSYPHDGGGVGDSNKSLLYSVRCLQDF